MLQADSLSRDTRRSPQSPARRDSDVESDSEPGTIPSPASRGSPFPSEVVFEQEPVLPLYNVTVNRRNISCQTTRRPGEMYSDWLDRITIKQLVLVDPKRLVPGSHNA